MTFRSFNPAEPLRDERIKGPKKVLEVDSFEIRTDLTAQEKRDFLHIRSLIRIGGDLEPYYRRNIGQDRDDLLMRHGVMHLHLGGKGSNALLYLLQFQDSVVFLCVDDHVHVDEKPAGKSLPFLAIKKAGRIEAQRLAEPFDRNEAIRSRLNLVKGSTRRTPKPGDVPED